MNKDWTESAHCKIHLDMHCPDWSDEILSRFDAKAIVNRVADAGADALYFFAKDTYGHTYFPTQVGKRYRHLGDRDFLAEVLKAAKSRSLPIVVYSTIIWDNDAAEQHPEWRMLDPKGHALSDTVTSDLGKWQYVCHNSGYADYMDAIIREIAESYDVDGFHLDMFNMDFGGLSCYCQACRELYQQRYERPIPEHSTWDEDWRDFLEFRYQTVEHLMIRLRQAARARNPDLPVVMNYHGAPGFDWRVSQLPVRHAAPSSLATGETYTPMFGDLYPALEGRFIRAIADGKPFEMVSWRMNRITDFTVKGLHQLRWEILTGLLHGGSTMLIDQPFHDGRLDPAAYDRIASVFTEAHQLIPEFTGEFVPHVALYYSSKTRDWFGRETQDRFVLPFMGAYKALVESHLQVDILPDELVSAERLAKFPVIFLPDVAVLSDEENKLIREYVASGGKLIATLETSRYDNDGQPLQEFQLGDVFGVRFLATVDCDNCYFQIGNDDLGADIDAEYNILCQGKANRVEATTAVGRGVLREAFHKRHVPEHFFSHNIHPPHRAIGHAVYRNSFGRGECTYLPFGLDRSYADSYELPEHRQLMKELVLSLEDSPLAEIEAPLNCEAVLRRSGDTLRIHMTMFNPLRQSTALPSLDRPIRPSIRMEEPAMYRATFRFKRPVRSAKALRDSTRIHVEGENLVEITCEDVHDTITVQW